MSLFEAVNAIWSMWSVRCCGCICGSVVFVIVVPCRCRSCAYVLICIGDCVCCVCLSHTMSGWLMLYVLWLDVGGLCVWCCSGA